MPWNAFSCAFFPLSSDTVGVWPARMSVSPRPSVDTAQGGAGAPGAAWRGGRGGRRFLRGHWLLAHGFLSCEAALFWPRGWRTGFGTAFTLLSVSIAVSGCGVFGSPSWVPGDTALGAPALGAPVCLPLPLLPQSARVCLTSDGEGSSCARLAGD